MGIEVRYYGSVEEVEDGAGAELVGLAGGVAGRLEEEVTTGRGVGESGARK